MAFEIAARAASAGAAEGRPGAARADHGVEVVTPEDYIGDVIGDLNSRRGQVTGMDARQRAGDHRDGAAGQDVRLLDTLRSMTQGRAKYTMQFDHYEPVPQSVAEEIARSYA